MRATSAFSGTTTKKYTAAAISTKETTALMKSPTGKIVPRTANLILEKSGLPTSAAIRGVRKLGQRRDHATESCADHHADRHIHNVAAKNEFLESAKHGEDSLGAGLKLPG